MSTESKPTKNLTPVAATLFSCAVALGIFFVVAYFGPGNKKFEELKPQLFTCLYNDKGVMIIDFSETVNKDGIYVNGKTGEELGVAIELTTFDVGCPSLVNRNTKIKVFK